MFKLQSSNPGMISRNTTDTEAISVTWGVNVTLGKGSCIANPYGETLLIDPEQE
jgi:hypothetical protein